MTKEESIKSIEEQDRLFLEDRERYILQRENQRKRRELIQDMQYRDEIRREEEKEKKYADKLFLEQSVSDEDKRFRQKIIQSGKEGMPVLVKGMLYYKRDKVDVEFGEGTLDAECYGKGLIYVQDLTILKEDK